MKKKGKDTLVVGLALFAMFFGAGNLIFPPDLGLQAGYGWKYTMLGFFLTGICLPLSGIMAVSMAGGSVEKLCKNVGVNFSKVLGIVIVLCIGPFLAIPRTGATTYEMGIAPLMPSCNSVVFSIVYFSITLFFVIKPTKVIDNIGKILTPILLLVLSIIIIIGIKSPLGVPGKPLVEHCFSNGFEGGYQTMDAICSILMATIVLKSFVDKGYKDSNTQIKLVLRAAIIAGLGLLFVYGGLLYLGATFNTILPKDIQKTKLVMEITKNSLGSMGTIALSICVTLACLTTSIGLTATVGNFFNDLSNGKLSYKLVSILTIIVSAFISNIGVETIVNISMPILIAVYPIAIVLILMNLFDKFIKNKNAYKGAVYGTLVVSIFDGLKAAGINTYIIGKFIKSLPLANQGFDWILPALIFSVLASLFMKDKNLKIKTTKKM